MRRLILPVKREWFEEIKAGNKSWEYRLQTAYWAKRLSKDYDQVIVTLGYPMRTDVDRRLAFPWRGYKETTVVHAEWNNVPQHVFAIRLSNASGKTAKDKTITDKQARILTLHDQGLTPVQIGEELVLSASVVKAQLTWIRKKVKAGHFQPPPL